MHKALGKGLEALIPSRAKEQAAELPLGERINKIEIDKISPNRYQPRIIFTEDKLNELSESIKEKGVVQPIIVTRKKDGFELVAGERRLRAAKKAGLKEIPAILKDIPENEIFEFSLIENIQREDLTPLEEAEAYSRLLKKTNMTQDDLAHRLGCGRSAISNSLRLLNLPGEIKGLINSGKLSAGHARALLSVEGTERAKLLEKILNEDIPVRSAEQIARKAKVKKNKSLKEKRRYEVEEFEQRLQHSLGTKVRIAHKKNKGHIDIYFYSQEDFSRLLKLLMKTKSRSA